MLCEGENTKLKSYNSRSMCFLFKDSKSHGSASQVKGHLDYMRQMDTILVAVGVPTKEVPGASFVLPGTVDMSETQRRAEEPEPRAGDSGDVREEEEAEEAGDGWDIPDISYLLDLPNDAESDRNTSACDSEEKASGGDAVPPSKSLPPDGAEDAEPDNEPVSWSWDDTQWTTEHTHKQRQADL